MRTSLRPLLASLCSVLIPAQALAQSTAAPPDPSVPSGAAQPEIVVRGSGLPPAPAAAAYGTITLPRETLRASASGRLEDALADVAGFQQFRRSDSRAANPSAQGVTLRALGGNATSRALVLLDGVPQADPFFGYVPFPALSPELLAGARITRGGGAGAFGSGGVAGTIELASAGRDELGQGQAQALVSDDGATSLSGALAPQLGGGFAVLSGQWDRGRGFWTAPVAQRDKLSTRARYASWNGGLRAVAPLAPDIELQARVAAFDDHRTLRFSGADSSSQGEDASLRLISRRAWQVEALAYVQARDFTSVTLSSNPALRFRKTLDQYATPSTGLGGKLEVRPPLNRPLLGGKQVLRLGVDWRRSSGTAAEAAYSTTTGLVTARRRAGGRNDDVGLYAEHDWTLGALSLTSGVRADRWVVAEGRFLQTNASGVGAPETLFPRRSGWDANGRAGLLLRAHRGVVLRAAAYTGTRLPTLNELYRPFTVVNVRTEANAALSNEHLEGAEAGLELTPFAGLRLSATAFTNRVRDAIENIPDPTNPNLRRRGNVDAIVARGLEFEAELHQGAVSASGSLALTRARVRASGTAAALNGQRPAQTPNLAASGTLAWTPRPEARLALTLRHTGAQLEDDLGIDRLPPATTVDAVAQWPLLPGLSLILRAENLADATVITRNQGGSIDLGTPRTIWAGLRAQLR